MSDKITASCLLNILTTLSNITRNNYSICGLSLLLVLSFAPRGFSPGTPVFPSPQKPTFSNSNSTRNRVDKEPLCGCATSNPYKMDLKKLSM